MCGCLEDAHKVFDQMPQPTSGDVEQGHYEDAMDLYNQMDEMGVEPNSFTFPRVLKACIGIESLRRGEDVHRHIIRCSYGGDQFVTNALVDMYAKCDKIVKAQQFAKMSERDIVS
jgi:pentatricopeptide repeat protein